MLTTFGVSSMMNCSNDTEAWVMARETYRYHFKRGHRFVHTGITKDLERREAEHKHEYGEDGHIVQVGRATTMDAALEWEREQAAKGRSTRRRP